MFWVKAHFSLEILTGTSDERDHVLLSARVFFNGLQKTNQYEKDDRDLGRISGGKKGISIRCFGGNTQGAIP